MLITKREEVTEQGFCKILWRKLRPRGILLLVFIQFQFQSHCHSSGLGGGWALIWVWLGGGGGGVWGWGWALIRRWALIRGWANKYGSIKTQWKGWVNFFKFQYMSILPIRCNRRQKTVSMAKYGLKKQNWNIIFEIKLMRTHSV